MWISKSFTKIYFFRLVLAWRRLRLVPLSLSPSCVTRKKTVEKNGRVKSWEREGPRISCGHFFFAVFFRVTHDGLSERGTNRSLSLAQKPLYLVGTVLKGKANRIACSTGVFFAHFTRTEAKAWRVHSASRARGEKRKKNQRLYAYYLGSRDGPVVVEKNGRVKSWEREGPRISCGHFFFAVFFRVTHDGLSERLSVFFAHFTRTEAKAW